jgi:hypothetical protein
MPQIIPSYENPFDTHGAAPQMRDERAEVAGKKSNGTAIEISWANEASDKPQLDEGELPLGAKKHPSGKED